MAKITWQLSLSFRQGCSIKYYSLVAKNISSITGGQFPIPAASSAPLLALRCSPAIKPYLSEDVAPSDPSSVSILVDSPITFSYISGAVPILGSPSHLGSLDVTVSVDGKKLTGGHVPLNVTKHALPFSLSSLKPRAEAYNITCSATLSSQKFYTTALLTYLPDPPADIGSVTKMDLRTGALLARPANGKGGPFETVFPIGFYTSYGGFLAKNYSTALPELKQQGYDIIPSLRFPSINVYNRFTIVCCSAIPKVE